jgi:hypothetical protein
MFREEIEGYAFAKIAQALDDRIMNERVVHDATLIALKLLLMRTGKKGLAESSNAELRSKDTVSCNEAFETILTEIRSLRNEMQVMRTDFLASKQPAPVSIHEPKSSSQIFLPKGQTEFVCEHEIPHFRENSRGQLPETRSFSDEISKSSPRLPLSRKTVSWCERNSHSERIDFPEQQDIRHSLDFPADRKQIEVGGGGKKEEVVEEFEENGSGVFGHSITVSQSHGSLLIEGDAFELESSAKPNLKDNVPLERRKKLMTEIDDLQVTRSDLDVDLPTSSLMSGINDDRFFNQEISSLTAQSQTREHFPESSLLFLSDDKKASPTFSTNRSPRSNSDLLGTIGPRAKEVFREPQVICLMFCILSRSRPWSEEFAFNLKMSILNFF